MTLTGLVHDAVRRGDVASLEALLRGHAALANSVSETDPRGTYPLHVAAEFGQAEAARLLIQHGADVTRLDAENAATALCWAGFFGRPAVAAVLLDARSEPSQRNRHGLTPLGCAAAGARGEWQQFSNATLDEWRQTADVIRARGGVE